MSLTVTSQQVHINIGIAFRSIRVRLLDDTIPQMINTAMFGMSSGFTHFYCTSFVIRSTRHSEPPFRTVHKCLSQGTLISFHLIIVPLIVTSFEATMSVGCGFVGIRHFSVGFKFISSCLDTRNRVVTLITVGALLSYPYAIYTQLHELRHSSS